MGGRVSLLGGLAIPFHRSAIVLWNTLAVGVHEAEVVLGERVPLLSQRLPFPQRSGEVATLGGLKPLVKVLGQHRR